MVQRYAFPFWGAGFDGGERVHTYEVRFASFEPGADPLSLARAFEQALVDSYDADVECGLAALESAWCADWMVIRLKRTSKGTGEEYPFSTCVENLLLTLHNEAPLREAVSLDAPAGWAWPWHDETVAAQALPSDAPTWDGLARLTGAYVNRPRFTAPVLTSEAFDAERKRLRPFL
ncbi:MAG: hypothetical protein KC668_12055 [Myxococcales bacterium]|nr:hypothetical protein [Myxococcales bacterium]